MRRYPNRRAADAAIERGLAFLAKRQLAHGEWSCRKHARPDLGDDGLPDSSPFATAQIVYALGLVAHPQAERLNRAALAFLRAELQPPGLWCYWSSRNASRIDPDLDDTACCSFVLTRAAGPDRAKLGNIETILVNRSDEGAFKTWVRAPEAANDVDSVVNANVLLYLGDRPEAVAVVQALLSVVRARAEAASTYYYLDPLSLHYAMSRAYAERVAALGAAAPFTAAYVAERQTGDGSVDGLPLQTALAGLSLLNFGCDAERVKAAAEFIVSAQRESGSWPRAACWAGPEPPARHGIWWGSEELTTGFALELLARAVRMDTDAD